MYRVIAPFTDLQDNNFKYQLGAEYPRAGLEVSKARIEELSTKKNRRGIPLIEKIGVDPVELEKEEPLPFTEPAEEIEEEKPVEKPKAKRSRKKG